MIYAGIGLIVGIIMGLTGAGGAMISIPLFLLFLRTTLKEATVLSLVAVVFGTAMNLINQISDVNKKIVVSFGLAGALTNYLSLPLKAGTPEWVIAALLALIGIYSIVSVLKSGQDTPQSPVDEKKVVIKAIISGAFLGLITTFTGLGGGVIVVPLLIKIFGKTYKEALPTSLATILFISLTAFVFQAKTAFALITPLQLIYIAGGALLAFLLLKMTLKNIPDGKMLKVRKIVFTGMTVYSVISVILKAI